MLVGVSFIVESSSVDVSGITYNSVGLTKVCEQSFGTDTRTEIWSLVNPGAVTANVVVSFSGASGHGKVVGVTTFTGVDQTTPLGTCSTSASGSVTVSSAVGELVFDTVVSKDSAISVGGGQTQRWNLSRAGSGGTAYGGGSTEPGAASVTMSWSGVAEAAIGAVPIKPVPPTVTLSLSGSPLAEAGGTATVTATLSNTHSQDVTVNLAFSGTATLTSDYTRSGTSITIPAGSTTGNITLTAVQDSIDEPNETIIVDISSVTNGTESGTQQVTATITDDDAAPTVSFGASSSSGAESTTSVSIPVSLSAASGQTVAVDYSRTGGSATPGGVDFTLNSGTLTFNPGETIKYVPITVVDDTVADSGETIEITLANPTNASLGANTVHTYTVIDPTIRFRSATQASVGTGVATLTLNVPAGTVQNDVMIAVVAVRPSASAITEPAGWTLIRLQPDNTNITQNLATYRRVASNSEPANYTWTFSGAPTGAVGGIMTFYGVDTTTPINVSGGQVAGSGDISAFVVTAPSVTTTVANTMLVTAYAVPSSGTPGSAWSPPLDMTEGGEGSSSTGTGGESMEMNYVALSAAGSSGTKGATIVGHNDSDGVAQSVALTPATAPTVTLSVDNSSIAEAGGTATVTATLSQAYGQPVTVNLAFSGTATTNTDYTTSASSITISPGNLTGSIILTATQDTIDEPNETIVVDITTVTNGSESGTQQVTVTITDDDAAPSVTLSISGTPMAEAGGVATVTATLSHTSTQAVTVNLTFSGTATLTSDYTRSGTAITIAAGSTTGSITLTAVQDAIDEPDETIIVDIDTVTNGTESGTQQVTATITDDDAAPTVTLSISGTPMAEAAGVATVTATLSAVSGQDVSVNLTFSGTATLTADYTRSGTSITIPAGSTTGNITLTAVQDSIDEPNETIIVDIDTVTNGTESGTQQVTATITDDDAAPTVTLSISGTPMAEAGGVATVTATLSAVSGQDVTVNLTFSGTATLTSDYTRSGTSITIPAGSTTGNITLTAVQDSIDEPNETIIVDIDTVTNGTESGTQQVTATITDDDAAPTVTLSISGSPMAEAAGVATVTATLSAVSGQDVSVNLTFSGTATLTADYTRSGTSITIPAGSTTGNITLTAVQDTIDEPNETIIVDIDTVTNGTESGTQQVTATITDDDAAPTVTLSISGSPMAEAAGVATVTATLSAVSGQDVTVNLAFSGTATLTSDYTRSGTAITITAGDTTGSITLTAVQDNIDEPDETIVVDIDTVINGTESGTQQVTATIADDDTAGITVTRTSGPTTTEEGGTATFTVVLDSAPTATVTIPISSSNTAEGTVSVPSLSFDASNWNAAQTVTVTGVDDVIDDGHIAYTVVIGPASSSDGNYHNLDPADLSMTNTDNEGSAGPAASQALWLRADRGVSLNGGVVDQWADQSGNGRDGLKDRAVPAPVWSPIL